MKKKETPILKVPFLHNGFYLLKIMLWPENRALFIVGLVDCNLLALKAPDLSFSASLAYLLTMMIERIDDGLLF